MSWEEDFLMREVGELKARIEALEAVCPGVSSEKSSGSRRRSGSKSATSPQQPVPTTENPSSPDPAESSTAPSTDGSGPKA